jgi:hypothetical protein
MLYAAIRTYSIIPQFVVEVMQRFTEGFLPLISQEPGYLAYYAMRLRDNQVSMISIFDTQAGTEESTPLTREWEQQNIAQFVQGVPEVQVGWLFAGSVGVKPMMSNADEIVAQAA